MRQVATSSTRLTRCTISEPNRKRDLLIEQACHEILGRTPDRIEAPGGDTRSSLRAYFGDNSLIVTYRKQEQRARLEALVLKTLSQMSVPAPQLIAWRGRWLLQQDLGGERLSQALVSADSERAHQLLDNAISGLAQAQLAGLRNNLQRHIVTLGEHRPWFDKLVQRRHAVAELLDLSAPALDEEALFSLLQVRIPRFIKWDARPGNALVSSEGQVSWIDWEHCGCRNSLDDLVWLLADEYNIADTATEKALLAHWVTPFSEGWDAGEALEYFYTYAVLHSIVRLHYVLRYKADGPWWDNDYCLRFDKIGVTHDCAQRLLQRALRWLPGAPLLSALEPWLAAARDVLPQD